MTLRLAFLAVAGCLVAPAPAVAADRVVERGIVQSLAPTAVVLRALDGTEVTVAVGPGTRYRLNGRAAPANAIQPGFVAEAVSEGPGPAIAVRAFGGGSLVQAGVLERKRLGMLVIRRAVGDTLRVALSRRTTVWLNGRRVAPRVLRRGMGVDIVLARDGSARAVIARSG